MRNGRSTLPNRRARPMLPTVPMELPPRYHEDWRAPFYSAIADRLGPGMTVLDLGSGRAPTVGPQGRPQGVRYVGFDVSEQELLAAGDGMYDEMIVDDAAHRVRSLEERIDLVVSWQVLEHIRPLSLAIGNLYAYLKPEGSLVALFSGRWGFFSVINQLIPDRVGLPLVSRVNRREEMKQPVFPAHYDRCWYGALNAEFAGWGSVAITPMYRAANYLTFSPAAMRIYIKYEDFVCKRRIRNLATHYLVIATK